MKYKFYYLCFFFVMFGSLVLHAQGRTITGTVADETGPLPGVSVIIKGTTTGTETDFDGKYSIIANKGDVLRFSFVGMATREVVVEDSSIINITLKADNVLDEVIVTGVASGTSRKKIGIAVNSVKSEDLQEAGAQSIDQALQGKIAGTVIQSTSGQPGQQQNIVLRAINSINSSQPMILIDGVEVLSSSNSIGGRSNRSSRLSDIDFSSIERVETIAGAAAGTIYGAQGANGVINIITKKGKAGKAKVTIRSNVGVAQAITNDAMRRTNLHHYQTDAQGFLIDLNGVPVTQLNNQSQYLAVAIAAVNVNGTQLGNAGINNTPFAEPLFDATDVLFHDAFNQTFGVSVSGGSDKINYLVSGNRTEQESVLVEGKYTKYDARINLGFDVSDKIKVTTRFDVINSINDTGTNTDNANANNLINNVFQNLPHVDLNIRNSNGNLVVQPDATDPNSTNPFFFRDIQTRQDEISRYIANVNFTYNPIDILSFNLKYGYDTYTENFNFFQENQSNHQQAAAIAANLTGVINLFQNQEYLQNFLASVNLNLDFKEKFGWKAPVVSNTTVNFDWRDKKFTQSLVSGTGLPFGGFGDFNINQASTKTFVGFFEAPFRTYGFSVNQKFDYGSLFGFSGGFRTDFSNRFGNGQNFTFPRADAYFNIADLWESDLVQIFKLRAAYGEAGIQPPFGQNLLTLAGLTIGSEVALAFPTPLNNEDLKVERSKEIEVGIDYTFTPGKGNWFSRINGSANYFDRETTDVVFFSETPPSSGSGQLFDNAYAITSDGIEFTIDTKMFKSDNFNWNFGLRFSSSKAILDKIASGQPLVVANNFVLEEGQEIGTFSTFEILTSIDQRDLQGNLIIPAANANNFTIVPESGYVVDKNTGAVQITPDKRVVGSSQPDFVMTFLNDFTFNDFVSLSVQLDWFQGLDVYNRAKQWLYNNALHADTAIPITIEDPTGTPQTGAFVNYYTSIYNTNVPTSHFVEDASFLRFRDISLNFKLNKVLKLDFIESLNVKISGRNLITITDFTGLDPEAARTFGTTFQRGFDEFTHPNTKSYNLSLNVTF